MDDIVAEAAMRAEEIGLEPGTPLRAALVRVTIAEGLYYLEHGDISNEAVLRDIMHLDPVQVINIVVNQYNAMSDQIKKPSPQGDMPRDEEERKQYIWLVTSIFMLRLGAELQRQRSASPASRSQG
jgi:hypothetical protein